MSTRKSAIILLIPVIFTIVYYQVFIADYAYLDEIHQLWHNRDGSNFTMFATQGRWLTGLLINKLYGSIDSISQLKYLRIFSLVGWIFTTCIFYFVLRKWALQKVLGERRALLLAFYVIVSAPVAIYIGWASCLELFIAILCGMISGKLLFDNLFGQTGYVKISNLALIGSVGFGIVSLFFYQNAFGIFLLPFLFLYVKEGSTKPGKTILIGLFYYLLIYIVYYLIYKYTLQSAHLTPSDRTGITTDIPGKISFFFSWPLPSSFSLNYLFETRNLFPQIFAPVIFFGWIVSFFIRYKKKDFFHNLIVLVSIFGFLLLIYLPSMISKENFASYRTLLPLQLAVFWLIIDQAAYFVRNIPFKNYLGLAFVFLLFITGFYNYNFQFVNPLRKEYKKISGYLSQHMQTIPDTIYFIRSDKRIFTSLYSIRSTGDEFGSPSSTRDWVPEPLIRQYIFEKTNSRETAGKVKVVQFASMDEFNKQGFAATTNSVVISVDEILQ